MITKHVNICRINNNKKMDSTFISKIYEEKGYEEFVQCLEFANKMDEDKLTTFTREQLVDKIRFLQKTNDILMEEIQKKKDSKLNPMTPPKEEDNTTKKVDKSKSNEYTQALLKILKKDPIQSSSSSTIDKKKNIIYQVLEMDTQYENMKMRIQHLKKGSNEYNRVRTEMQRIEKEMSILVSRMATLARRGHEASKIPEDLSKTIGSFTDGTPVKLHRFTRNLFTEDIMDENGDILNVDFIKFYQTYEKKLGSHDVIWYSLSDKGRTHFQDCIKNSSIHKFVELATFHLLDQVVPIKSNKS